MARISNRSDFRCSFCGKPQDQVTRLIAGPDALICNECVVLSQEIISGQHDSSE